jgi:hypothetical protein
MAAEKIEKVEQAKVNKRRGPKPKIDEYYVNPAEFKQQIKTYYKTEICIYELANSLKKIAYGLGNKSNFINYTYKEEMIGDALVKMYTALKNKKFNVDSEYNPFSYFTTIAFHAFINRIKKEKKHHETLCNYKEMVYEEEMTAVTDGRVYVKPNSDDIDYSN